jgi:hypothetical protein
VSELALLLCADDPAAFLARPAARLTWDSITATGTFGGLRLSVRPWRDDDPLPTPAFAGHFTTVVVAAGTCADPDAFEAWSEALAEATNGASYDLTGRRFRYVHTDTGPTELAATALLADGELAALAAWITALADAPPAPYIPDPAARQLAAIEALAVPALEARIAAGDAAAVAAVRALHAAFAGAYGTERLTALARAADRLT